MSEERNYSRDLAEIRSMMERSTKFMSLSGLAGIMAGIYALAGAWIAWRHLGFTPGGIVYRPAASDSLESSLPQVVLLGLLVLILAVGTAIFLSSRKAGRRGEKAWNATSRRLIANMAVPLAAGGILILIFLSKGLIGLMPPATLLFYGLALYNASKFTFDDVKFLGLIQMALGLASFYFVAWGLLFWAVGFGAVHIIYGIYMHLRYER